MEHAPVVDACAVACFCKARRMRRCLLLQGLHTLAYTTAQHTRNTQRSRTLARMPACPHASLFFVFYFFCSHSPKRVARQFVACALCVHCHWQVATPAAQENGLQSFQGLQGMQGMQGGPEGAGAAGLHAYHAAADGQQGLQHLTHAAPSHNYLQPHQQPAPPEWQNVPQPQPQEPPQLEQLQQHQVEQLQQHQPHPLGPGMPGNYAQQMAAAHHTALQSPQQPPDAQHVHHNYHQQIPSTASAAPYSSPLVTPLQTHAHHQPFPVDAQAQAQAQHAQAQHAQFAAQSLHSYSGAGDGNTGTVAGTANTGASWHTPSNAATSNGTASWHAPSQVPSMPSSSLSPGLLVPHANAMHLAPMC